MGFKEYKKRLNTIKSLKERISKISSLIENKKKLEKLEREYTNTKENHLKVMETLYPYNSILEVGKENIINLARKYKNAEEEIKKLNNMHFSVQKEIEKLNEEKQLREKNISKFKAILETEELGVNKFNELQETRSSIQIGKETFDVKKEYIKDINEKIFKLEKRLDLLEKKNVPFTIDEWTVSKISEWRELLKPIIIEQIDSLRMDYRLLENSILAEKESISKMKRTSKFPLVSFALNINMQFDENYEVLIRKNTDINNKLSHLKNELEPLTEFKVLNINVLENELENITQTVAKMELTVSDFTIYKNYTENEFLEMGDKYNAEKVELGIRIELLCQISEENTARFYFTNYKQNKRAMWNAERRSEKLQIEKENKIVELDKIQKNLEKELSLYFSKSTMNEIYQKIDPHDVMKRLEYHLSFNDEQWMLG